MLASYLAFFLMLHVAILSVVQMSIVLSRRLSGRIWLTSLVVLLLLLLFVTTGASLAVPGSNAVAATARVFEDRTHFAIAATAILSAVFAVQGLNSPASRPMRMFAWVTYASTIVAVGSIMLKDAIGAYLPDRQRLAGSQYLFSGDVVSGFRLDEIADLQIAPTCMAFGPEGALYVAGYGGIANQNGVVISIAFSSSATPTQSTVASYLNRPHGLAFLGADLFVSRAGQFTRAINGEIVQENTGAVTRLRDFDGDGVFDHYADVVSDLPGAQQPDGMHQNNGIAFDSHGRLYITVGSPTDHGPAAHRYAGTILRANADGTGVEVFARGFRNPFGIAIGPHDQLFCTDNDAAADLGDKLIHVHQGQHHGHPYDSLGKLVEVQNSVAPLLLCSSAQGLTYVPAGALKPGFDDALYVAGFGDGIIYRVVLTPTSETFEARLEFFAKVPDVIALAVSPEGDLFACSYSQRKLYRISLQE
jgi:glucose/arabinose dehydrogenase